MHKIKVDGQVKTLAEIKDLKEIAYDGFLAKGPSYAGICSEKGIRVRSIKGKSIQNLGGGLLAQRIRLKLRALKSQNLNR